MINACSTSPARSRRLKSQPTVGSRRRNCRQLSRNGGMRPNRCCRLMRILTNGALTSRPLSPRPTRHWEQIHFRRPSAEPTPARCRHSRHAIPAPKSCVWSPSATNSNCCKAKVRSSSACATPRKSAGKRIAAGVGMAGRTCARQRFDRGREGHAEAGNTFPFQSPGFCRRHECACTCETRGSQCAGTAPTTSRPFRIKSRQPASAAKANHL